MAGELQYVGVVGLGTMGAGIAEVFARNGLTVVAVDKDEAAVQRGRGHVEASTGRAVNRGKLSAQDQQALIERITFSTDMSALAEVDLVVEAVPELMALKRAIFGRLDAVCKQETILASNTSSLSITEIAVSTGRPGKVVGLHFFNPAPVMKLVEIVRTVVTEQDVVDDVEAFAQRLGKTDVTIGDRAGFIANALLFGYLNHAVSLYESRYASREDIDAAMKLGCGLPMGPLALLDLIGIDTAHEILNTMYAQSRDRLHAPQPMLKQLVTAGLLGRKSGRGFYTYAGPNSPSVLPDALTRSADAALAGARRVDSVGIVGSGAAAVGIAAVLVTAGYEVTVVARPPERPDGIVSALSGSAPARVTASLDDLRGAQLVIEAVAEDAESGENLAVKRALFAELDGRCAPGTVLATTTSSLPVIECAAATSRPADVIGMHFVGPAARPRLVEVVSTVSTAADVEATVLEVSRRIDIRAVRCGDRAGFVVDALLFPYLNDAIKMLEAHYASADDIDAAMKVGCGYPMGPFEQLDIVGNDVALATERRLFQESREPGLAPAPLLEHLVTAGRLGHRTGQGFRIHT